MPTVAQCRFAATAEFLEEAKAVAGTLEGQAEFYEEETEDPRLDSPTVRRLMGIVVAKICEAQKVLEKMKDGAA